MKKQLLFLVVIFNSISFLHSQTTNNINYYLQLDESKSDESKLAVNLKMVKAGFTNEYIPISKYYFSIKSYSKGYKYFKKAIVSGGNYDYLKKNIYVPQLWEKRMDKIYPKLRTKFYSKFDEKLYNYVNYLYNVDQYFASEKFYGGRKEQHPIRKKIFQNNLSKLRSHIVTYNNGLLPQKQQVGELTTAVIVMLIHHTRLDSIDEVNYNFFEPLVKEEVLKRKTYSPYTYVQLVDNMQQVMEEGKLQVYGHYRNFKTNKICMLKYPEKVDSLRAAIGLQSLKEYAKKNNFLLPDNYIEK